MMVPTFAPGLARLRQIFNRLDFGCRTRAEDKIKNPMLEIGAKSFSGSDGQLFEQRNAVAVRGSAAPAYSPSG